jgi:hypothetical protein
MRRSVEATAQPRTAPQAAEDLQAEGWPGAAADRLDPAKGARMKGFVKDTEAFDGKTTE